MNQVSCCRSCSSGPQIRATIALCWHSLSAFLTRDTHVAVSVAMNAAVQAERTGCNKYLIISYGSFYYLKVKEENHKKKLCKMDNTIAKLRPQYNNKVEMHVADATFITRALFRKFLQIYSALWMIIYKK